jgi:hypothetical protein
MQVDAHQGGWRRELQYVESTVKKLREMSALMVQSAGLMSEVPRATDRVTVLEGYDAMRVFLETAWERQGKDTEEIALLLGGSRWVDGTPVDPTTWEDWLEAIRIAMSLGR